MPATTSADGPIRRVELRSDTFTLPTPEMLGAMAGAALGDDVYGEDPTVNALERRAADLLAKEAACFMPSGTMGNLAAIMTHCPRGSKVIVGAESDIYVYEAGGASVCGGVTYHPVANRPDGTLALEDIEAAFPGDPDDPQFALPALICLENPQNHCGGRVLPAAYLERVRALARARGVPVHLDGSRIFNAAVACGLAPERLAACADSVQFCLSKGLSAPVGSMVVGSGPFIDGVRRTRKMLGGGMRQAGVLAAAGLVALDRMVARLGEDHANARRLAEGLARLDGVDLDPRPVEINMVFFRLRDPEQPVGRFVARAGALGVEIAELGPGRIRCVTHAGVTAEDVDHALNVFAKALSSPLGPT